ncbi:cystathionine gamma-synthase [Pseudoxanthomonas broegbernensis]|uniref:Cystathionine gamma-synthase n=1 Tax=Pseudoxanthomonas broegbernensis TaxID=83619 RepID=A0A7V8K7P0_9GAMM|nr:aminotransferase class V-fold PLP-dependent enzyme [Pseudoxanthomonas broegbernensis]KAF1687402.1 cystathionine gamma-synthase [Pseudoxanthomonas broegbernensis]MBB6065702.1 cystathionine gamma-synthase [Pseudoxanthomonas broegbernensis]
MTRIETLAARAGSTPDPSSGALAPPLQLATTFEHTPDVQLPHGFLYQRYDNPTQRETERVLAALDGAARALLFPTGMAAGATALQALPAGSHVLLCDDSYFSFRVIARDWFPRWGLACTIVDFTDLDAVRAALRPETRLLWAETPSNPLLKVSDIAALAGIAHGAGARLLVDGTFAPPTLQQPLALGADVVMHSATKYLGGHGDVMGGVLSFRDDGEHAAACHGLRLLAGATASPFAAWMILRGVRSLPARMDWHCRNAQAVAEFLAGHARVEKVHYPGLPGHPQHAVAARQMRQFGGMLSFEAAGGREAALAVAARMRLFTNATSLGSTESLVEHRASIEGPLSTTPEGLLRLSVGLEHAGDLVADLAQALEAG